MTRLRAQRSGWYPSSAAHRRTRSFVLSLTGDLPVNALDTVMADRSSFLAISSIVVLPLNFCANHAPLFRLIRVRCRRIPTCHPPAMTQRKTFDFYSMKLLEILQFHS